MTDDARECRVAGTSPLEFDDVLKTVLNVFRGVLRKPELRASDDFLAAGGDSLLAISAIFKIAEITGLEISTFEIFFTPSAEGLARAIVPGRVHD